MKHILVIDDNDLVVATIKTILECAHYRVTASTDARGALMNTDFSAFDAVVIDVFMPGCDGIETMAAIHKSHPMLPIVIVSGHVSSHGAVSCPDFLSMAVKLGAYAALAKPFTASALVSVIDRACPRSREMRPIAGNGASG